MPARTTRSTPRGTGSRRSPCYAAQAQAYKVPVATDGIANVRAELAIADVGVTDL